MKVKVKVLYSFPVEVAILTEIPEFSDIGVLDSTRVWFNISALKLAFSFIASNADPLMEHSNTDLAISCQRCFVELNRCVEDARWEGMPFC